MHKNNNPENALTNETSPYLLQHARNPVEWYPWGAEALGRHAGKTSRFCYPWAILPVTGAMSWPMNHSKTRKPPG